MKFSKAPKEPLRFDYNPPVGHYDITDSPILISRKPSKNIENLKPITENNSLLQSRPKLIDLQHPLHSYASAKQRVIQNRKYNSVRQSATKKIQLSDLEKEFDQRQSPRQQIKGKIYKSSNHTMNPTSREISDASTLFLGNVNVNNESQTSKMQYMKNPPKHQSLDSLELFLLQDKATFKPQIPGPGAYNLRSIFDQKKSKFEPFAKSSQRITIFDKNKSNEQSNVGVGSYDIVMEEQKGKNVLKFNQYAKRKDLFPILNTPTFYDASIGQAYPKNSQFPVVFGSGSRR